MFTSQHWCSDTKGAATDFWLGGGDEVQIKRSQYIGFQKLLKCVVYSYIDCRRIECGLGMDYGLIICRLDKSVDAADCPLVPNLTAPGGSAQSQPCRAGGFEHPRLHKPASGPRSDTRLAAFERA